MYWLTMPESLTYLDKFLTTNLKGTYFTTQAVVPQMLKQKDGVVINIGTPLVNHGLGGWPATAPIASKGAIHAITVQLAAEFGKQNIRFNTVAPGVIRTPMHGDKADLTFVKQSRRNRRCCRNGLYCCKKYFYHRRNHQC
jgi:NAD(P)-dependent dehydrogenase (short-subunit alcohol dehydrogenase family)